MCGLQFCGNERHGSGGSARQMRTIKRLMTRTISRDCSRTLHRYKAAEEESLLQRNNRCFFNYVSKRLHPKSSSIVLNDGDTSLSTPGDIAQCFAKELSKNVLTDINSKGNASAIYVGPTHSVIYSESVSAPISVIAEVIQGSVLGPLLFVGIY